MVGWKSRWSWVRLVKMAAAKRRPPRARARARARRPRARTPGRPGPASRAGPPADRSPRASSADRGARPAGHDRLTVPNSPHDRPQASISRRTRKAVVVLPFVPVTPTRSSSRAGIAVEAARERAHSGTDGGTRTSGRPSPRGRSTTSAAAPACMPRGEVVTVADETADAEEQRSGSDRAAVVGQAERSPPAGPDRGLRLAGTRRPWMSSWSRIGPGAGMRRV